MADRSARLDALELGSRVTVEVARSELLAMAALLPVMDGGALPGADDLLAVPGWKTARALLVHGLTLRDELAETYLAGSTDVPDASKVPEWITARPPVWWRSLLARGAHGGLTYYRHHMAPIEAVESLISAWPRGIPSRADLMSDRQLWREAVTAQVLTWPDSDALLGAFLEVSSLLASCVASGWKLAATAFEKAEMPRSWPPLPDGVGAVDALRHLTGRLVPQAVAASVESASRFVFVPTPSLGSHLLAATFRDTVVAWGEVADAGTPAGEKKDASGAFTALGSDVNRRILSALAEGPPRAAQDLARQLSLHPSTISRHLPALIDADLVESVAESGHVTYRLDSSGIRLAHGWLDGLAH